MASHGLVEVDSIEIKVLVDNEVDPITPSNNPAVQYRGLMQGVPLDPLPIDDSRGGAQAELSMSNICCGAHGLSLMIVRRPLYSFASLPRHLCRGKGGGGGSGGFLAEKLSWST